MSHLQKVLVTGAGGFIGHHLVKKLLAEGYRVVAVDTNLDALRSQKDHRNLDSVLLDIRSVKSHPKLLQDVDLIFHLAAAHLEAGATDDFFYSINVAALEELLQMASAAGIRRFVHCSTVGVYGPLTSIPADENTSCNPDIVYESSKLQGELVLARAVKSLGLEAVVLRPAWVYGPGCPRTLKLVRSIKDKKFFFAGDGSNLRHPVYISDMCAGFEHAANARLESGETIIIAGPQAVSTRELVGEITAQLSSNFNPPSLPVGVVAAGCHILEAAYSIIGREPPFSTRSLKFFTESSAFSIDKARRMLGYEPSVDLADGISRTISFYKKEGLI